MTRNLLLFAILAGLFFGCKQKDITPAWLKIDSFELVTNEITQGVNSHGITDAWVYMDGNPLGVFEVPCEIPVLAEGEHKFLIFAGIKTNGISKTRMRYPFYEAYGLTTSLSKNDTVVVNPVVKYKNSATFPFLEDFEDAGISFIKGPTSDTDIVFITEDEYPEIVKYGDKCGGIFLSGNDTVFTASTESFLDLPQGGETVFLEIDYRNNNSIGMGVIARFPDGTVDEHTPLLIMNPQDEGEEVWKKIYINLTEDVSYEIQASAYEFYFLSGLDSGINLGEIYLDNVKVVHYQQ